MVVIDKPSKKYCCSDIPELEAKILAIFSLITSCFCTFLLFLVYAHVQSQFLLLPRNLTKAHAHVEITSTSAPTPNQAIDDGLPQPLFALCSKIMEELNKGLDVDEEYLNLSESEKDESKDKNRTEIYESAEIPDIESHINSTFNPIATNVSIPPSTSTSTSTSTEKSPLKHVNGSSTNSTKADAQNRSVIENVSDSDADAEYLDIDNDLSRDLMEQCGLNKKKTNSSKVRGMTTLDSLASFMAWNKETEREWILIPFLWNALDMIRAVLLIQAIKKKSIAFSKIWYILTIATCMMGTGFTIAVLASTVSGSFKTTFTHLFVLLLLYNFYALWIVYLYIKETKRKMKSGSVSESESPSPTIKDGQIENSNSNDNGKSKPVFAWSGSGIGAGLQAATVTATAGASIIHI